MTSYLLAGPAVEPISLAETKLFLKIDGADEDQLVSTLISAARMHLEGVTGRVLVDQDWRLAVDRWPPNRVIALPNAPLVNLIGVTAYDTQGTPVVLDHTSFQTEPGAVPPRVYLPEHMPAIPPLRRHAAIEIDYRAGYGADASRVPAQLRQALLQLIAHWFENRAAVVTAGTGSIIPESFERLVGPFRSFAL